MCMCVCVSVCVVVWVSARVCKLYVSECVSVFVCAGMHVFVSEHILVCVG